MLSLGTLRPGSLTVEAGAYNLACGAVGRATVPSWIGERVTVQVSAGLLSDLSLTLRPNTSTAATVDFVVPAVSVVAGSASSYAVLSDGTARAWGRNEAGQLGDGSTQGRSAPTPITGLSRVVQISAGDAHACALLSDGTAWCWGEGQNGRLGNGGTSRSSVPVAVRMPEGISFTQISAGAAHSCAMGSDGFVYCWGRNNALQLGPVSSEDSAVPTFVESIFRSAEVYSGRATTCASTLRGRIACWGDNSDGLFGIDSLDSPGMITTPYYPAVGFALGGQHACARLADQTVVCAGGNASGQLGRGSTSPRELGASAVPGLTDVIDLAAGRVHSCAVRADRTAVCWGDGTGGALGDGGGVRRAAPVAVSGLSDVSDLAAGDGHSCALRRDGSILCWGRNDHGQLGDGSVRDRFVPVKVQL